MRLNAHEHAAILFGKRVQNGARRPLLLQHCLKVFNSLTALFELLLGLLQLLIEVLLFLRNSVVLLDDLPNSQLRLFQLFFG